MYILSDKKAKARKEHICNLCCDPIEKGEFYYKQVNVDGGLNEFKRHIKCDEVCEMMDWYSDDGIDSNLFTELVVDECSIIVGDRARNMEFSEKLDIVYKNLKEKQHEK